MNKQVNIIEGYTHCFSPDIEWFTDDYKSYETHKDAEEHLKSLNYELDEDGIYFKTVNLIEVNLAKIQAIK